MSERVTVIDIVAQVTDQTAAGARSATENVGRLERTMQRVQGEIDRMSRMSRLELTMYAVDNASRVMNNVIGLGHNIAGKVWRGTLKVLDFATAPIRGVIDLLRNPVLQMAGIAGISLGTAEMVNTGMGFEQSMANIRAVASMAQDDVSHLGRAFRDMAVSGSYGFAATEIAAAAKNFVTIGSSTDDILKKMGYAMTLSAASGMDLYNTTYYVNTMMNKLGGGTDLAGKAIDSLAQTVALSHQPLGTLMSSWNYMGTAVRNANMSMDEANAMLILFAEAGYRGSGAGTQFNQMMRELKNTSNDALAALDFSMFDDYGNVRSFGTAMRDLSDRLNGLGSAYERNAKMEGIFGVQGARSMTVILDNIDALGGHIEAVKGAADAFDGYGAAAGMAGIRTDTTANSFARLRNAVSEFNKSIYERAAPHLRGLVDWLGGRVPAATEIAVRAFDWMEGKVTNLFSTIQGFTGTDEWADADFFGRIGIAWDNIIAQPFGEWWGSSGQAWAVGAAGKVGGFLGGGIRSALGALFDTDSDAAGFLSTILGAVREIGGELVSQFRDAFAEFDWSIVTAGLGRALGAAIDLVFSNPVTGGIAKAWIAAKVVGGVKAAFGVGSAIKGVAGTVAGVGAGTKIAGAAAGVGAGAAAGAKKGTLFGPKGILVGAIIGSVGALIAGVVGDFPGKSDEAGRTIGEKIGGFFRSITDTVSEMSGKTAFQIAAEAGEAFSELGGRVLTPLRNLAGEIYTGFHEFARSTSDEVQTAIANADARMREAWARVSDEVKTRLAEFSVRLPALPSVTVAEFSTRNEPAHSGVERGAMAHFERSVGIDAESGIFGAYANGGIVGSRGFRPISTFIDSRGVMGRAHVGLVGEDGAEAIIPLSGKRRQRGLALWEQAGRMLGVRPYDDGGIFSAVSGGGSAGGGGVVAPVKIDNVVHLHVSITPASANDADTIVRTLKANVKDLTDELAHDLGIKLLQVWDNLSIEATRN